MRQDGIAQMTERQDGIAEIASIVGETTLQPLEPGAEDKDEHQDNRDRDESGPARTQK